MATAAAKLVDMKVSKEQLDLPAGYDAHGKMVTLKEIASKQSATVSLSQLSGEQKAELVAQRIEAQPKFELAMIGPGIITKERAAAEVRARSQVGLTLIEIEQRMLSRMLKSIGI